MVHAPHAPSHAGLQPARHAGVESGEPAHGPAGTSIDVQAAWQLLLELAARARAQRSLRARAAFALRGQRWLELPLAQTPAPLEAHVWLDGAQAKLEQTHAATSEAHALLALFAPLVLGPRADSLVMGHLGQSLDGRVATPTGASQFITGREDVVHTHRLRALFDAVIVGVRTVELDDPQLTTRLVSGPHPTRVVLDPQAKLAGRRRKLLEDGGAATLVFCAREALPSEEQRGAVTWLASPFSEGRLDLCGVLAALRARGLARVFVEGGGVTISRFVSAGLLDRLHVSVAPVILGSGAPAFALPPIDRLDEALQLSCSHHALGRDVLFDCALIKKPAPSA
jgi:riboflavin-specific deaminase-like protein